MRHFGCLPKLHTSQRKKELHGSVARMRATLRQGATMKGTIPRWNISTEMFLSLGG